METVLINNSYVCVCICACEKECVLRVRGCEKNVVSNFTSCNHKYFISDINENFSIYFGKDMINLQCICKQFFLYSILSVRITDFFYLFFFLTMNCRKLVLFLCYRFLL